MQSFSFIHAADLHLDSPFASLAGESMNIASQMRSATFTAFTNIIEICIKKKVDFLLIAGDVYDGEDRSLRAQVRFRDGLKKLSDAGISSFVVHGNHDPVGSWSTSLDWPERVHIFSDSLNSFHVRRNNDLLAVIQGISYPKKNEKRNLARMFKRTDDAVFQIGLLHTNVGTNTGHEPYAPSTLEDLKKSGMDYWALGHVHEKKILSDNNPVVLYPGNAQGRSVREAGEKGCYLINVDDHNNIEKKFISTHAIRWEVLEIPSGDLSTEQGLINRLEQRCVEISEDSRNIGNIKNIENDKSRPVIVRFIITGRGPLSKTLMNPAIVSDLLDIIREAGVSCSPFVWVEQIKVCMSPELDFNTIMKQEDFPGELLRFSEELLKGDDFEQFIKDEISTLYENNRAEKIIALPQKERLVSLIREAGTICIEGLLKGDK